VNTIRRLTEAARPHGIAHITGGGFAENVPRMWRGELDATIDTSKLPKLPVFAFLAAQGIDEAEMYETFNMGIGMVVAVAPEEVHAALDSLNDAEARVIGTIQAGSGEVHLV
jgi:phosphoribosylformylglycinamidine cyclo-ligase